MIEDGFPIIEASQWKAIPGAIAGALELIEIDKEKGGTGQKKYWKCKCHKCHKCQRTDLVSKREDNLKIGAIGGVIYPSGRKYNGTRSCGCKQKNSFVAANTVGTKLQNDLTGQILNGWKVIEKTSLKDLNSSWLYLVQSVEYPDYFNILSGRHLKDGYCANANIKNKYQKIEKKIKAFQSPKPKMSKGEELIFQLCKQNHLHGNWQYSDERCKSKSCLPFDFAIKDNYGKIKYLIEFDGEQHFKYVPFFHESEDVFLYQRAKDLIKNKFCFDNNIPLIRIPYNAIIENSDIILETTRFLLTPENEQEYYNRS